MQSGHSGLAHLEGRIRINESKTIDDATLELAKLVKRRRMRSRGLDKSSNCRFSNNLNLLCRKWVHGKTIGA